MNIIYKLVVKPELENKLNLLMNVMLVELVIQSFSNQENVIMKSNNSRNSLLNQNLKVNKIIGKKNKC